ncbi:MAG: hypothetical protein KDC47_10410 [Flavobacteriaceae bacterium]|nr:hypothetical protein [Flavobacteriaceae bacterium]
MFKQIFIERESLNNKYTQNILTYFKNIPTQQIEKIEDIWGRSKRPYLQKRTDLNLFIGRKKGELIKKAPHAYGIDRGLHYYFIHAYNCIYECQYCYLQGHFNTPDIVLFVNHDEIIQEMTRLLLENPAEEIWFHAGEFSDSLALSHITKEYDAYWKFFELNPRAQLELRSKSVNTRELERLRPLGNVHISFTISSAEQAKIYDLKCPSIKARISAIKKLALLGHKIGIHLDPLVINDHFESEYQQLTSDLFTEVPVKQISYVSIGVVRFTKDVFYEVKKNYPKSPYLAQDMIKSFDGKLRYPRPIRMWAINKVRQMCIDYGVSESLIYRCME